MSEIHVVAIITPAAGKEARVKELLTEFVAEVYTHEPDTLKYHLFEQSGAAEGTNVFVIEEIYKDQASWDAHKATDYFQSLGKTGAEEGIVSAPLDIKIIKPIGGFTSR